MVRARRARHRISPASGAQGGYLDDVRVNFGYSLVIFWGTLTQ